MKMISWFSCGAASAVATKMALDANPDTTVYYQDTGSEHPDNARFLGECESWYDTKIHVVRSPLYPDAWSVWEKRRYIAGVKGAPCTSELKRIPAEKILFSSDFGVGTPEVFGFTVEEEGRMLRWRENNDERVIWAPLIDRGMTKADCFSALLAQGIKLPALYLMGYKNNNCIGCPKGGSGYWNKIRIDFPDVFTRMAKLERELGAAICKTEPTVGGVRQRIRVFLDELSPDAGRYSSEPSISCGIFCAGPEDN